MQNSTSKTVLVLKTRDSHYFEEAHLILKDKVEPRDLSDSMVEEANRIILQAEAKKADFSIKADTKPTADPRLRWLLTGIFLGLGCCALGALLLSLLI